MSDGKAHSTASRGRAQLATFPGWEWSLDLDLDHYHVLPRSSDADDDEGDPVVSPGVIGADPVWLTP